MKENSRFKFRAWDYESERWVYGYYTKLFQGIRKYDAIVSEEDGSLVRYYIHDIKTLGQYTGLKDKNGVEIYEGDIIRDGSRLWKITISPIYGIFFTLTKGGHTRCYSDFASNLVDDFEVIGNIYEHSHLLDNNL